MVVKLIRLESSVAGTFGVLLIEGETFCVTLEREDLNNIMNYSCIPAGVYLCERIVSPSKGETFEVKDVYNRTNILFHAGNVVGNTKGCILLAQYFGKLKGDRAILNSGKTFDSFMERLQDVDHFALQIVDNDE